MVDTVNNGFYISMRTVADYHIDNLFLNILFEHPFYVADSEGSRTYSIISPGWQFKSLQTLFIVTVLTSPFDNILSTIAGEIPFDLK